MMSMLTSRVSMSPPANRTTPLPVALNSFLVLHKLRTQSKSVLSVVLADVGGVE